MFSYINYKYNSYYCYNCQHFGLPKYKAYYLLDELIYESLIQDNLLIESFYNSDQSLISQLNKNYVTNLVKFPLFDIRDKVKLTKYTDLYKVYV